MHPVILIPLVSCVLAAMIAAAIVSHDPGQRANRIIALILAFLNPIAVVIAIVSAAEYQRMHPIRLFTILDKRYDWITPGLSQLAKIIV